MPSMRMRWLLAIDAYVGTKVPYVGYVAPTGAYVGRNI